MVIFLENAPKLGRLHICKGELNMKSETMSATSRTVSLKLTGTFYILDSLRMSDFSNTAHWSFGKCWD